ncbi:MAG TPA: ZIP family metal transporter [Candidatus Saccharimonadales bacterium]|nr:ZIP family metal transporter [Candidatus Saccharimonadales bacterium]
MATYWHVIFYSLIGGLFSLIGGLLLLSRRRTADLLAEYATPLAAGALIAAVFLDLLKDGLEEAVPSTVLLAAMIGIIVFFYAERFLHWFHHHHQDEDTDPAVGLIVTGDILHNALDGIAIAAAFLVSVPTGIVTTVAVAAHEIPQEIGDFGLLLSKGLSRAKVLLVNAVSALATTVAAVVTFWLGSAEKLPVGALLGLSAGFLLYIALSDIIPTIHDRTPKHKLFDIRPLLLLAGVIFVGVSVQLAHRYIDVGHDSEETVVEQHHDEESH